jgi:hypothetical protein
MKNNPFRLVISGCLIPICFGSTREYELKKLPRLSRRCLTVGLLNKVNALMSSAKVTDVNTIQNAPASKYFGKKATGTAGAYFDKKQPVAGGAYTFIGKASGITGIYRRGGATGMSVSLKLHEVTHLAYPVGSDLDISLAALLEVRYSPGADLDATATNASKALGRYFESGCNMKNRNRR